MKTLPVIVLKRSASIGYGCYVTYLSRLDMEIASQSFEKSETTFSDVPKAVIIAHPELLECLTDDEIHAMYMHEQGHIESGHGLVQKEVSLSHAQEIQADDWAIAEAGIKPAVLKSMLLKVIAKICNSNEEHTAHILKVIEPRLRYLS